MHHTKALQDAEELILVVLGSADIATGLELSMITVIATFQNGDDNGSSATP